MAALACSLLLAGCSDKNDNATPTGTTILAWDHTQSERASMKTAKLGERKTTNVAHKTKLADGSPVEVGVTVETAPVTLDEDGVTKEYVAPVRVTVTLDKNADFTFAEGKCIGPNYQTARPTPREMLLECRVRARKASADVVLALDILGDGRVEDSVAAPK